VTRAAPDLIALGAGSQPSWLTPEANLSVQQAEDSPFGDAEYEGRLTRVRRRMSNRGMDALLIFRPSSIEYLCGYHTAERAPQPLLVTDTSSLLYVPDLELGRALACARVDAIGYCGYADALRGLELFLGHVAHQLTPAARVGIELGPASAPPQAVALLQSKPLELLPGHQLVERERLTLSAAEIHCVEQAAICTRAGLDAAIAEARRPGATDSSVGAAIAAALTQEANATPAWGPVVATGRRAGIAHSSWVRLPLSAPTTFLEFAGAYHRYHAPVMRTLSHGRPGSDVQRLADLAKSALAAVLDSAHAGVPAAHVARRAAQALGRLPEDVVFHQVFGYPVGLAHPPHWMDGAPFYITHDNHEPLDAGMVFHIPASFRSFGRTGVGLSQTFVVEHNATRVLTHGVADLVEV